MNLILQHWTGDLDELGRLSSQNISGYAARVGAEYRLLRGNVFRKHLAPPCQKLHMLSEEFDGYEWVVMLDMDMFSVTPENVFEVEGTGLFSEFTRKVFAACRTRHPQHTSDRHAYWGGAIYRMHRDLRRTLRNHIREADLLEFNESFHDEGIVHRLAMLAGIKQDRMPDRWCHCSYRPDPQAAAMIHVRKRSASGVVRTKLDNYRSLVEQGVL